MSLFETKRLSDIEIKRVFEVSCAECGVIDAPASYSTAIASRRRHWELRHDDRPATEQYRRPR